MKNNFKRIEKKFWLNKKQYEELINFLKDKIETSEYKKYTVYNLYLDDDIYSLIRNSIKRPYFKEKIRLRCYELPKEDSTYYILINDDTYTLTMNDNIASNSNNMNFTNRERNNRFPGNVKR